jgi:Ras-related protein Rab-11A
MEDYDFLYKIVVIGDSGVGKTQLLERFSKNTFDLESKSTIGVEFSTKLINIDNMKIKLQLWDTAGQERYRAITSAYYRGAMGVIFCFDLTKNVSFENIIKENGWYKEALNNADEAKYILVGTKSDLLHLRDTNKKGIEEFTKNNDIKFIETSSLDNTNVNDAICELVRNINNDRKNISFNKEIKETNKTNIIEFREQPKTKPKKECCV